MNTGTGPLICSRPWHFINLIYLLTYLQFQTVRVLVLNFFCTTGSQSKQAAVIYFTLIFLKKNPYFSSRWTSPWFKSANRALQDVTCISHCYIEPDRPCSVCLVTTAVAAAGPYSHTTLKHAAKFTQYGHVQSVSKNGPLLHFQIIPTNVFQYQRFIAKCLKQKTSWDFHVSATTEASEH